MKARIISGVVMAVCALLGIFALPNDWFSLAVLVIFLIGLHEWSRMTNQKLESYLRAALLLGLLACVSYYTELPSHWVAMAGVLYWGLQTLLLCKEATASNFNFIAGVFALWFAWEALSFLHAISPKVSLLGLLMVWSADSLAYWGGKYLGRTKLAPTISPGKTWEGVASGALGSVVLSLLYCATVLPQINSWQQFSLVSMLAIAVSLIAVVGDLSESKLKRAANMKDSGSVIPGHGGVLDRVDGLIAGLPLFAFCWQFVSH